MSDYFSDVRAEQHSWGTVLKAVTTSINPDPTIPRFVVNAAIHSSTADELLPISRVPIALHGNP